MVKKFDSGRVEALLDALPFIQKFRGQTFVIKYGGSAMEDDHLIERLLRDVVFLESVGINPVLIHGGGKAITQRMREAGQTPRFVNGLRVTDEHAIAIVEEVLDQVIRPRIVATINEFGGKAEGFSGRDVFVAKKISPQADGKNIVDVVSPIAESQDGVVLNVNADLGAGALAGAVKASKMIYVSDVLGVMRDVKDTSSLIPTLNLAGIRQLTEDGIIEGGMIPKVQSALVAIDHGVSKVHLIDGRIPHALLLEIFTADGIGTEIVA